MPRTMMFTTRMIRMTAATLFAVGAAGAIACGSEGRTVDIDEPLAPVENPDDDDARAANGEVATLTGPQSITLVAIDGERTMAYALVLEIEDIAALPLDEAVEAGPGRAVRIIEIGSGEIPVINEAACAALDNPSPACDREVTLYETSPPREHTGVMTLWTNEDVLTGLVDAELSYGENVRGTFSIDI